MDRFLYAHPAKYFYCDGTRSIANTGEVLPHSNGEMMLTVVGVGPVRAGYSSFSFITSAALHELLKQHGPTKGPPFVVNCAMGSTLHALGAICLSIRVHRSTTRLPDDPITGTQPDTGGGQHGNWQPHCFTTGSGTHWASADETYYDPTVVTLPFVIVEGEGKECMLDTAALTYLGLSEGTLTRTISHLSDPVATFHRACLIVHRAQSPATGMAYYPLPQGTPPPRLTFGIGHSATRTIKGVLVTMQPGNAIGQATFITHQVLEGSGVNVLMSPPLADLASQPHVSDRDVGLMAVAIAHAKSENEGGAHLVEQIAEEIGPWSMEHHGEKDLGLRPPCTAVGRARGDAAMQAWM